MQITIVIYDPTMVLCINYSIISLLFNNYSSLSRKPTDDESEWPPYSRDEPQYFIFDAEKIGLGKGPRTTYCAFWNDFLPKLKGVPGLYNLEIIPISSPSLSCYNTHFRSKVASSNFDF